MIYYPYKNLRGLSIVMVVFIFVLAAVLFLGWTEGSTRLFMVCLIMLALVVFVDLISLSKVSVSLDDKGILIHNSIANYSQSLSWAELNYGYYLRSSKGHKHILLSTTELTSSMLKKYFRESTTILAQFKKNKSKEYICFSLENDINHKVNQFISAHVSIQEDGLHVS